MQNIDFWQLLLLAQEYISDRYSAALTEKDKLSQLKAYLEKYIHDNDYEVGGYNLKALVDRLYCEMAEYSVLTPFLNSQELEEINVNAWNDIALTYRDGSIIKLKEHFYTPQHAIDIIKRLLHHSGMIIDNATPIAQGHLPGNTRITVLKEPVVDEGVGISCSIRLAIPIYRFRSHGGRLGRTGFFRPLLKKRRLRLYGLLHRLRLFLFGLFHQLIKEFILLTLLLKKSAT